MKWAYCQKNRRTKILIYLAAGVVVAVLGTGYWLVVKEPKANNTRVPTATVEVPTPTAVPDRRAKLIAVGDMLIHDDVYNAFRLGATDTFDFRPAFASIKPIIQKGDFNIVNEETILGGVELGLSGLYVANSPQELGDAFIDTGFNIIQLANNHAYDRGLAGMVSTLGFWSKHKDVAITSGVYDSQVARDTVPVIEKNSIKLAFLSYTFGSNLGTGPNSYNLNIINKDLIAADIAKAKTAADVVVVGLHWGIENTQQPTSEQKELAQFIADQGADIIYGTHPHELQPPAWVTGQNGHQTYVMYSLGNFLSIDTLDAPRTLTGAIMGVDITKKASGEVVINNPFAVLTWNYFSSSETGFKVMPFDSVTQNDFRWGDWPAYKTQTESLMRQNILDLTLL